MEEWPDYITDFPAHLSEDRIDEECRRERARLAPLILAARAAAWQATVKDQYVAPYEFKISGHKETLIRLTAELHERFENFEYQHDAYAHDIDSDPDMRWDKVGADVVGIEARCGYRITFTTKS